MSNRFFPNYDGYVITSRFGMRTLSGVTKMHNGIDLNASNDGETGQIDDVMAHTGGTVYSVGYGSSAGNYIKIQVEDGAIMVYYHLKEKPTLKKGQAVQQGQIIGRVGATGNAKGPHLHWGIQKDGKWIDPEPYLDRDYIEPPRTITLELPVLKKGDKGDTVEALQLLLIGNDCDCGPEGADGSLGGATDRALRRYQTNHGLAVGAGCDAATWASLMGL